MSRGPGATLGGRRCVLVGALCWLLVVFAVLDSMDQAPILVPLGASFAAPAEDDDNDEDGSHLTSRPVVIVDTAAVHLCSRATRMSASTRVTPEIWRQSPSQTRGPPGFTFGSIRSPPQPPARLSVTV